MKRGAAVLVDRVQLSSFGYKGLHYVLSACRCCYVEGRPGGLEQQMRDINVISKDHILSTTRLIYMGSTITMNCTMPFV